MPAYVAIIVGESGLQSGIKPGNAMRASARKNWTMEMTDTPWAVGETALAHNFGNSTEQAYARSDLYQRRRTLMQEWADYLTGCELGSNYLNGVDN